MKNVKKSLGPGNYVKCPTGENEKVYGRIP